MQTLRCEKRTFRIKELVHMCWGVAAFVFGSRHGGLAHIWMKLAKCWEQQIGALCSSCSQSNPGPKQSWKGSNTPSSCRNGKRSGFSCLSVFVLFLFLFCYLRDSWKRRVLEPAAVPRGCLNALPQPAEQCPLLHKHSSGLVLGWTER